MGNGRNVQKLVKLVFQSNNPKQIRLLEGETELVYSNQPVTIKDFMGRAGESFDLSSQTTNQFKLTYLGPVNYAALRQECIKTNWVSENSGLLTKEFPAETNNALHFSLEDPEGVLIAPWGHNEITFLDNKGQSLPVASVMTSGKARVYRFQNLPPPETQLQIYLAAPEILQRVPFKIENIPLR
jgi:hypothetical protein